MRVYIITLTIILITCLRANNFEAFVQTGHSGKITSIAFSEDGKRFLSGSEDGLVKLWDIATGREIRSFTHNGYVTTVAFSDNEEYVISGCLNNDNNTLKIWKTIDGENVNCFDFKRDIYNLKVINKNKIIIVSDYIFELDMLEKIITKTKFKTDYDSYRNNSSSYISEDGNYLIIKTKEKEDKTTKIWMNFIDLNSNKQIYKKEFIHKIQESYYNVPLIIRNNDLIIASFVFDIESLNLNHAIDVEHNSICSDLSDNKSKMIFGNISGDFSIHNFLTNETKSFKANTDDFNSVKFSHDAKFIVSGSKDGVLKLWNSASGNLIKTFQGKLITPQVVSISNDSNTLIAGYNTGEIILWDINNFNLLKRFYYHKDGIISLEFSKDSNKILSSSADGTVKYWNIRTEKIIFETICFTHIVKSILFEKQNSIYIIDSNNIVKMYNIETKKKFDSFKFHENKESIGSKKDYPQMIFHNDFLLSTSYHVFNKLIIYDIEKRKENFFNLRQDEDYTVCAKALDISDDKSIVAMYIDQYMLNTNPYISIWDSKLNNLLNKIYLKTYPKSNIFMISNDNSKIYIQNSNNELSVYRILDGKIIEKYRNHSDVINSIEHSENDKYIVTSSTDGTINIINMKNRESVYLVADADKWIVYNKNGIFNGSTNCGTMLNIVDNLNVYAVDQFAPFKNRPDLILTSMDSQNNALIDLYHKQYEKRLKKMDLSINNNDNDRFLLPTVKIISEKQDRKDLEIEFKITGNGFKLNSYNIYINNVPLFGLEGKNCKGESSIIKTEIIELSDGLNKIEISSLNEKGIESYRVLLTKNYESKSKINSLYVLCFGISQYQDNTLNLKYADKDALDFSNLFRDTSLVDEYKCIYIKTFLNEEVTKQSLTRAKEFLKNNKIDDTVILFIAGHGIYDDNYYYLSYDTDLDDIANTAINFDNFENLLLSLQARNKYFFMDTCESGEKDDSYSIFHSNNDEYISRGILLKNKQYKSLIMKNEIYQKNQYIFNNLFRNSGTIIISSSRGNELSYEMDKIENGIFTQEIINCLTSDKADVNKDNLISKYELINYISSAVSDNTNGLQNPTIDRDNLYLDIKIPIIKKR